MMARHWLGLAASLVVAASATGCHWNIADGGSGCDDGRVGAGATGGGHGGPVACRAHADCAPGSYCDGGACTPSDACDADLACPEGFLCDADRATCVPAPAPIPCAADADCAAGSLCTAGVCAPADACSTDADCGDGVTCDEALGLCVAGEDPPPACADLATEDDCVGRADCQPVYAGVDCSCGADCTCTGGEPGCVCASFEFFKCEPVGP